MPSSSVDGENYSPHVLLEDSCGTFGAGPRDAREYLSVQVVGHFNKHHPDQNVIVEGLSFTYRPAPMLCDVCNISVELPYWTHTCTPPLDEAQMIDDDGLWCVCDPCHDFVMARNLSALVRRSVANAIEQSPGLWSESNNAMYFRTEAAKRFRTLLERFDEGKREKLIS